MLKYKAVICCYCRCFCVDKAGNRIFGEQEWAVAENMTCGECWCILIHQHNQHYINFYQNYKLPSDG
jgi:hypothetical protein